MSRPPDAILKALADPTRRAIFESLIDSERPVTHLTRKMRVSQPAVSQHLAVLRDAGLVTPRQDGRHRYYRAEPAGLTPLVHWLNHYQDFWASRFEKLKLTLEELE